MLRFRSLLAFALLFLASPLWAGDDSAAVPDLAGSQWTGDEDGQNLSVSFADDGRCTFAGDQNGEGTWRQVGSAVYFRKSGGGVYLGELGGQRLHGVAWDRQREWKWSLRKGGARPESAATAAGTWSEDFGKPGETDVTYHDQYEVSIDEDGTAQVKILVRNQKIENVRLAGNRLTFRLMTSFWIEYDLRLEPDGNTMIGTAKTPNKLVNITWHRVRPGGNPPQPKGTASVAGRWSEDFGKPGETDVDYHDQYQVDVAEDGSVRVKMIGKEYKIDNEKLAGNRLTFQLHTAFQLDYDLKLEADGDTLIGTAKTPHKLVNITWRRVK